MKKLILIMIVLAIIPVCIAADEVVFSSGLYEVYEHSGRELLSVQNCEPVEIEDRLSEPECYLPFKLPDDKAVKEVRLVSSSSEVDIAADLPHVFFQSGYLGYKDRECIINEWDVFMDYDIKYDFESSIDFTFRPLAAIDCEKGQWRLYRLITAEVDYYEVNKFALIDHTPFQGSSDAKIYLKLENLKSDSYLYVYNTAYEIIFEGQAKKEMTIDVDVGDTGNAGFIFEIEEDYEIVDRAIVQDKLKWGTVDFRVLVSEEETIMPLAIEINNLLDEEIPIVLTIKAVGKDLQDGTTVVKKLNAPTGKRILYTDFEVSLDEIAADIYVEAVYSGLREYKEYNSILRYTKDEVKGGMPLTPRDQLIENIAKGIVEENKKKISFGMMTAIIVIVLLFLGAGYFIWDYFRD